MRTNFMKTIGFGLFIGLLMPAGMLFAKAPAPVIGVTTNTSRTYDRDEASSLLNRIQDLAIKARETVGPINVDEIDLRWQGQAVELDRAKSSVDRMGDDLLRLDEISSRLEPWQQRLIHKITPQVHEMAYQLDAAITTLNKYQLRDRLALTHYPQYINDFCKSSNRVEDTISTFTQYVQAKQKMAELNKMNGAKASS